MYVFKNETEMLLKIKLKTLKNKKVQKFLKSFSGFSKLDKILDKYFVQFQKSKKSFGKKVEKICYHKF